MKKTLVGSMIATTLLISATASSFADSSLSSSSSQSSSVNDSVSDVIVLPKFSPYYDKDKDVDGGDMNISQSFSGSPIWGYLYGYPNKADKIRFTIKNDGNKEFKYELSDPYGYSWASGTLSPGATYTTTYDINNSNYNGIWLLRANASDSGTCHIQASMKNGVL